MQIKETGSALILFSLLMAGCTQKDKVPVPNYFKNLYTQEILDDSGFKDLLGQIYEEYNDSVKGSPYVIFHNESLIEAGDSVIQPFKYDVRIGNEYKVRARSYEKIGMTVSPKIFKTLHGDTIQIGGAQEKPTVVNLWFIGCRGCVEEIPALNRLQEKYADNVNFVAITFDNEDDVLKFLRKRKFTYQHIASKNWKYKETSTEDYLKYIGSYPYPETIFIDRNGTVRYVEGVLPVDEDLDNVIKHFESIVEELLLPAES